LRPDSTFTVKDVVNRWSWFDKEDEQIFLCIKHKLIL